MIQIIWSERFELGHEQLDGEHRRLVGLINNIYAADARSRDHSMIDLVLDGLSLAAKQHFKNENVILLNINRGQIPANVDRLQFIQAMIDAAIEKHADGHTRCMDQLRSIISDIRSMVDATVPRLNLGLHDWFVEHATVYDAPLKPIFAALKRSRAH